MSDNVKHLLNQYEEANQRIAENEAQSYDERVSATHRINFVKRIRRHYESGNKIDKRYMDALAELYR